MSIWRLIFREIAFRKLNFGLALLAATMAVACVAVVVTLLHQDDLVTEDIMQKHDAATDALNRKHEDDIRKATLKLGFNVLILPKDQNLADLYAEDFASKYMPEEYAQRLVKAKVITIKHLLPNLQQRLYWKEAGRTVILYGTRGEIDKSGKKALLDGVPSGKVVIGHELHQALRLKKGDKIVFAFSQGTGSAKEELEPIELVVHELGKRRENKDDITLFVNLADAQRLLKKKGQINSLLALECDCGVERLANIRAEIGRILPDTQVIEFQSQAVARAEARTQAAVNRDKVRAQLAANRTQIRQRHEEFAGLLVPLVVLGCTVILGVLAFVNVQERVTEIGILRALGVNSGQVFALFLTKAILAGVLGALLGYCLGVVAGFYLGERPGETALVDVMSGWLGAAVLAATPLLCALASLVPALRAAGQDPAIVLQQE